MGIQSNSIIGTKCSLSKNDIETILNCEELGTDTDDSDFIEMDTEDEDYRICKCSSYLAEIRNLLQLVLTPTEISELKRLADSEMATCKDRIVLFCRNQCYDMH